MRFGPFTTSIDESGVCLALFDRPPANAFSAEAYDALGGLIDHVQVSDEVRVLVLAAPAGARAWCGGADLNDFVGMNPEKRKARYEFINAVLPRFAALDRPTIAAVNAHAVGVGVILAGLCDLRYAASTAAFWCPEIDYGLVGGGAGLFSYLNLPEGFIREMLYTGRRFSADEMFRAGFLNGVTTRDDVVPRALETARVISAKSLPALKARKQVFTGIEGQSWNDAYLLAQAASAGLVAGRDAGEGVDAFLEKRPARLADQ